MDNVWLIKRPVLYNIETHSMEKNVQALGHETGQVYKGEQGQLSVHVVVNWPISARLLGDKEYKKFCEMA